MNILETNFKENQKTPYMENMPNFNTANPNVHPDKELNSDEERQFLRSNTDLNSNMATYSEHGVRKLIRTMDGFDLCADNFASDPNLTSEDEDDLIVEFRTKKVKKQN